MKLTLESSHQEKIMDLDNKTILIISLLNCCTSFDPISPLILQVFCNLVLTTLEFPTPAKTTHLSTPHLIDNGVCISLLNKILLIIIFLVQSHTKVDQNSNLFFKSCILNIQEFVTLQNYQKLTRLIHKNCMKNVT